MRETDAGAVRFQHRQSRAQTVQCEDALYVLHAFQKKSTHGVKTPQRELDLVSARLKLAEALHRKREKQ